METINNENSSSNSLGMLLINAIGFEDACLVLYGLMRPLFHNNSQEVNYEEIKQFVREEFDAAVDGDDFAREFVQKRCPDSDWYEGALQEDPIYPIDYAGGPQQYLLALTYAMDQDNADLALKMRCKIVGLFFDAYCSHEIDMDFDYHPPVYAAALPIEVEERELKLIELLNNPKVQEAIETHKQANSN